MQAPIVTLTMNPALDISTDVERIESERKLRCATEVFHPGGGGVNVSRAIANLGGASAAIYPLGGPTGERYRELAAAAGVDGHVIAIGGNTRENFTVNEAVTGSQYRFILPGPTLLESEWGACLSAVEHQLPHGGYLLASGSLPPGVPADFYARLARIAAGHDVRLIVDTSGAPLSAALDSGVYAIKPSGDELAELVGADHELDHENQVRAAQAIVAGGRASVVALTLGAAGAILVTSEAVHHLRTPAITPVSAVGAGDAFLAALVLRLAQGGALAAAFRTAVAAGSATAMLPATELCQSDDVARLERQVVFESPRGVQRQRGDFGG